MPSAVSAWPTLQDEKWADWVPIEYTVSHTSAIRIPLDEPAFEAFASPKLEFGFWTTCLHFRCKIYCNYCFAVKEKLYQIYPKTSYNRELILSKGEVNVVQPMRITGESDLTVLKFIIEEKGNTRHYQICLFKVCWAYFEDFRVGGKRWKIMARESEK